MVYLIRYGQQVKKSDVTNFASNQRRTIAWEITNGGSS